MTFSGGIVSKSMDWFIYDSELRHEIVKLFSELYFGVNGSKQCYVNRKHNKYSEHQSRKYMPPR